MPLWCSPGDSTVQHADILLSYCTVCEGRALLCLILHVQLPLVNAAALRDDDVRLICLFVRSFV